MKPKRLGEMKFKQWDCVLFETKYIFGDRKAWILEDASDGSPVATCSVNLPDEPLSDNEIFIKDYSENEGMLKALIERGFVEDTGRRVPSGWVNIPVAKIIIKGEVIWK